MSFSEGRDTIIIKSTTAFTQSFYFIFYKYLVWCLCHIAEEWVNNLVSIEMGKERLCVDPVQLPTWLGYMEKRDWYRPHFRKCHITYLCYDYLAHRCLSFRLRILYRSSHLTFTINHGWVAKTSPERWGTTLLKIKSLTYGSYS